MRSVDIMLIIAAFLLSAGFTGLMRIYAQRANLLDVPNQRSSHQVATPRGGGLSIVIVFLGVVIWLYARGRLPTDVFSSLLVGGFLVAGIGFADDHRHVPAKWRFLIQIIAATFAVAMLGGLPELQLGNSVVDLGLVGDAMAIVFMVWFINLYNFMDGIDGIAASETICIAGGALVLSAAHDDSVNMLSAVLTAATLGFLFWNWPPAKIFMGDVGSAFLGFVLIAIAIATGRDGSIAIWSWLILGGVFIVDATTTLIIRIIKREDWLSAHRSHAYQKASRRFGSHRRVAVGVIAINVFWLFPLAYAASAVPQYGWWLIVAAWIPLVGLSLWFGAGGAED